ncbi:MAG TPA: phenylalanine--tRNA ligase subunit beta [Gemmatimonadaceae bacterium]|nr:phenylalanine--tRNA ligase subunit beta [Gemmatimonadaceae bacterium]
MNASHAWLQSLLTVPLSAERMRELITAHCCTVDELVRLRDDLRGVVIGRVVEAARHPDSDHLWVTKVDAGLGTLLDVVCGAPNVKVGAAYPFAPVGTTLPGGLVLERRKIRGALSNGMLCSARELRLSDDHEGILELETSAAPGTPLLDAIPLGDTRLVIDVTPNRPDLLSHAGLARELAAAVGAQMRLPPVPGAASSAVAPAVRADSEMQVGGVRVRLEDPEGCPRYMGVVMRLIAVGPSPAWLAERIVAVGGRSINNVVDATNYVLHELGQPVHAFDVAKLGGSEIVVRRARAGETIVTLDGVSRTLDANTTVIADDDRAQAVAGVMGGAESEVTAETTAIFIEVAHFDPVGVRRARRALGLSTDASYRFERHVDIELPPRALARVVEIVAAVAGGRVDGAPGDLYPAPHVPPTVSLRPARVATVLGEAVPQNEIVRLLTPLGFEVDARAGTLQVTVPSWRPDVVREVDLVEEVARRRGYDTFSSELRPFRPGTVPESSLEAVSRRVRDALVARGLLEARPLPFVKGADIGFVRVANPLSENEAHLRRDLLDTLAGRAEYNLARMQRDVRLFEIGSVFLPSADTLPLEELRAALIVMGHRRPAHWTETRPPDFDEWDAKGLAEELASAAYPAAEIALESDADPDWLWSISTDGTRRGGVRRVALDAPVWAAPAFGVELTLLTVPSGYIAQPGSARYDAMPPESKPHHVQYRALPATPAAEFDLALIVPNDMPAARVEDVIRAASGELLEQVTLFDEYRGDAVPNGFRSLAWRLTFRHPERTLRDKEVAGRREKLLRTLEGELGVRQRTS